MKNILMPALSPTMEKGNLVSWLKSEGDKIELGDIIAEIETDKATMEVEAMDKGVLGKILVKAGTEDVAVNTPIAVLLENGENPSDIKVDAVADSGNKNDADPKPEVSVQEPVKNNDAHGSNNGTRIIASPLAKKIASLNNIDLSNVCGSGPNGRIQKADVEALIGNGSCCNSKCEQPKCMNSFAPISSERDKDGLPPYELLKLSSMRKTIAKRLVESKQMAPHFYLTVPMEIDELLNLRKVANAAYDMKMTINDFIIKAVAMTLMSVKEANRSWFDGVDVRQYNTADIAVAVAIDGGLITPIIRSAEKKTVREISIEMKDLIARAKSGKLKPEEFTGGTFSISNLGMYGVEQFEAVINPPHGCILAVGAGKETAVVKNGNIQIANVMKTTLSVDHRVVDGAVGAAFLKQLKIFIETPSIMLV